MRRSASEIIRNLERRIARLEKKATYGVQVKKERPKSGDVTPKDHEFRSFEIDLEHYLSRNNMNKEQYRLTHCRSVAGRTDTVEPSAGYPDGAYTTELVEFYIDSYAPNRNWDGSVNENAGQYITTLKWYFKYVDSVLAGGMLVNGEIVSIREAKAYIAKADWTK
jgi:hypothetical protein